MPDMKDVSYALCFNCASVYKISNKNQLKCSYCKHCVDIELYKKILGFAKTAVHFGYVYRKKYEEIINNISKRIIPNPIIGNTVEIRLDYFHINKRLMDMDNIAKCVLDALTGIAYVDDRQVILQAATAHSLASIIIITNGIVDLIKPLAQYEEYLFIRVRNVIDTSTVYDKRK